MENTSLSDVWNNVTTSSSTEDDFESKFLADIRYITLKVVYVIIGTVGVVDNLFVIAVFALFIKIASKVLTASNVHSRVKFGGSWWEVRYHTSHFSPQHPIARSHTSSLGSCIHVHDSYTAYFHSLNAKLKAISPTFLESITFHNFNVHSHNLAWHRLLAT